MKLGDRLERWAFGRCAAEGLSVADIERLHVVGEIVLLAVAIGLVWLAVFLAGLAIGWAL